jgi:dsDNA-binding SOS-regulon protein
MKQLVFKRKKRLPIEATGQVVIKINAESYNKVLEVADETGESLRNIVSRMVEFAYENITYESEE